MYGFVYITENKINGKKYIGMCKNTHEKNYLGSGKILKDAIKKYGKENFERTILQECKTFDELCAAEKHWIKEFDAVKSEDFYNIIYGGFGGCSLGAKEYWQQFSKEERKQLRKWKRDNKKGIHNGMFGKKHSEETKKLIGSKSVNRKWGRKTPPVGANNPRAKRVNLVKSDGTKELFDCIKNISQMYDIPYSALKGIYRNKRFSKKYGIRIVDV